MGKQNKMVRIAAKIIAISLITISVLEVTSFVVYDFVLPDPMIQEGNYYKINDNYGFYDFRFESVGDKIKVDKSKDGIRIFSFGASTTAGWPYGNEYSYTSWLNEYLTAIHKPEAIEVVNLAIPGFDSREILHTVEKSIQFSPDIIIVYTSHNTIEEYNLKKIKLGFFSGFYNTFSGSYLLKLLNHYANILVSSYLYNWTIMPAKTSQQVFENPIITNDEKEKLKRNYSNNINSIVEICRENNVKLMIVKPIYNMLHRGPAHSFFVNQLSEVERASFNSNLFKGIELYKKNDIRQALELFQKNLEIDPDVAILQFYVANCYYFMNNTDKAIYHRKKSTDLDGLWSVCPESYHQILNTIEERQDLCVVNLLEEISRKTNTYYLEEHWLVDDIHPTLNAHPIIAEILLENLLKKDWVVDEDYQLVKKHDSLDLRAEFGDEKYYNFCKSFAIYKWHLANWTFDPVPFLKEARSYMQIFFEYIRLQGATSFDGEVFYYLIERELGSNPNLQDLVNKWSMKSLEEFVNGSKNPYNHLDGFKEELENFKKAQNS